MGLKNFFENFAKSVDPKTRKPYILKQLKKISKGNPKTHKILAEFLNSGIPEERAISCYVLSELDAEMLSDAIEDKLVEMQWYDQIKSVQRAALVCLHKTGRESKVFEFILNLLADSLESVKKHDVTVAALEWIVNNSNRVKDTRSGSVEHFFIRRWLNFENCDKIKFCRKIAKKK